MHAAQDAFTILRPHLVGQDWSAYEGCSALGVLIRLTRLNYLESSDIQVCLGLKVRRKVNLLRLLCATDRHASLAAAQGFVGTFVDDWQLDTWWPFGSEPPWELLTAHLRVCPVCVLHGYHTMLFQLPGVDICPWHRVRVIDGCHRCGKPLLDGFDHGMALLQCLCGHDHVDVGAMRCIAGDSANDVPRHQALHEYRTSAKARRAFAWQVGPEPWDGQALDALRVLMRPYERQPVSNQHMWMTEEVQVRKSHDHASRRVTPDSGLDQYRPTVVKLPTAWQPALQSVLRRGAAMPSPGLLSGAELRALGATSGSQTKRPAANGARFGLLQLRPSQVAGSTYLYTGVIEGSTVRMIGTLADGIGTQEIPITDGRQRRAFRGFVLQHDLGHALTSEVLRRLLTRGYADGCRQVLGQVDPDLYRDRTTRPVRRFPWVSLTFGDEVSFARIVWTRQPDQ